MSIAVSTITSLIGNTPLGLMSAHHFFSNHPTDTNPNFSGKGYFSGGDLPFGLIYQFTIIDATAAHRWTESLVFTNALAHIVNLADIHAGFTLPVPVEEFFPNRDIGLLLFDEPTTSRITVEFVGGNQCDFWGLYIDIPLVTPSQPTWTQTSSSGNTLTPYESGAVFTGLSGTGTLALSGNAVGAQINVTTVPPYIGETAGTPITLFDVGWVTWGDGFAFRERERITSEAFQTFPRRPAFAPALGYSLNAGVVISVTELLDRAPSAEGGLS